MATLSTNNPTLLDIQKRLEPDGSIAQIIEILNETNEILTDLTFMEGNLPTGHRTSVRTGLPEATWRKLYGGVQPVKSTTATITDTCGTLENYSEVDQQLADLNGNTMEYRLSEDRAIIEGIGQQMAEAIFYADEDVNPERFTGLAPRYNSLSADNADNIINAGGGSNRTSIWLVVWSPLTCHGIYPKGMQAGLQMQDLGQVTIENVDGQGGRMQAYRSHYRWQAGVSLRDWRYVVRIANIDVSALKVDPTPDTDVVLHNLMFEAMERIPSFGMGNAAFYMRREVLTKVRQQLSSAGEQSFLTADMVGGTMVQSFQGIPIRRVDRISKAETAVT